MSQIKSQYEEARIPFAKMSFTPDVPSTALGPNEYNDGKNVEADIRGIRSVAGDEEILDTVPGTPTFVTGGYRQGGEFWFIVATTEGYWYAASATTTWYNITPGGGPIAGYNQATNIVDSWNGTVPFFNDSLNPPMFLPDEPGAVLVQYSGLIQPIDITALTIGLTTVTASFGTPYATVPYIAGQKIVISGVSTYFDGIYTVVSSTVNDVTYAGVPGAPAPTPIPTTALVSPAYTWNYNPNWKNYYAGFMRMYSTPNVGSILVAGNLTATNLDDTTTNYPVTIQWSQNFGLNEAPRTWQPTVTNVANQLEVPLRGPALDGFPCNGQFFLCSYWDTVVFSPINYSTTTAPILGVRIFNQGRGLLSSNCWGNTDKMVYGVDARDIWAFDGTDFTGLGNQRVKNWFYDRLDPQYHDRVFVEVNTRKNQVEIYFPDTDATNGVPNKMISYRYDLDVWNAPRDVDSATMACESPIYTGSTPEYGSRTVVYAKGLTGHKLVQKDQGYTWGDGSAIESHFVRDNIKMQANYSGKTMVHRILPEVNNLTETDLPVNPATSTHKGNITVTIKGANSVGSAPTSITPVTKPIDTSDPWYQINQNAYRVNSIELSNTSNNSIWICEATTWQFTQVEDDR